ncbi:MAG: lipopolysaccharide biosynthesis protein [Alistipes sp.]|nr:lipopolysaccharide biosynthesis protein [Alistipes sp.]
MSSATAHKTTRGVFWAGIDRFGIVLLQFVINLVLARLLTPGDFGCISMILIFVAVSQTLIDGGFGAALIQKIDATQRDYSTIFYWNALFSVGLYLIIYAAAPSVATFFRMPLLEDMLRVLGVVIIINSLSLVQRTILRKAINFKVIAIVDIISYSASALVAIYLAHRDFGAWSIVGMQLSIATISTTLLWLLSKWCPSLTFSFDSLKSLFSYGGFLLIASIMQDVCTHIQGVVIGRRFSAAETGLYSQAKKMDEVASMTLPAVFCQVLFPIYSEKQNNISELRSMLSQNMKMISFIIFPLMMLLIIVAKPLFILLYGDQWIDAVPYFQILCIGGFFSALYNFNYYAVAAVGKSKALFYWGCYKWGVLLVLLLIGASFSMLGVLIAMVISNINIYLTNTLLAQRYIGYRLGQQIVDVVPTLLTTIISGAIVFPIFLLTGIHWLLCCIIFAIIYLFISYIFKLDGLSYIKSFIISRISKRRV